MFTGWGLGKGTGGILLTGGASRRMGFDKATMVISGMPLARRVARALGAVTEPAIEVGPGVSGLPVAREENPGKGPLAAVCAGASALKSLGFSGPVLVVACDLPLLTGTALGVIANWPGERSVVPVVDGHPQPLCARWSAADLATAEALVAAGDLSMTALLSGSTPLFVDEASWPDDLDRSAFRDVDTPEDLDRLGLR